LNVQKINLGGICIFQWILSRANAEANELLGQLWRAATRLPAEQRDAFAFRFEDPAGQDLFTVLVGAGIVNWADRLKK